MSTVTAKLEGLVTPATWMRKDRAHAYELERLATEACNPLDEPARPSDRWLPGACTALAARGAGVPSAMVLTTNIA